MNFDVQAVQSEIAAGLPAHARWMIKDVPLDFDFQDGHQGMFPVSDDDVGRYVDERWLDGLVFGRCDYAAGGGATPLLTIQRCDGSVWGIDIERQPAVFLYNSSLGRFINFFRVLGGHLGRGQPLPPEIEMTLGKIDPDSYASSEWRFMVEWLLAD